MGVLRRLRARVRRVRRRLGRGEEGFGLIELVVAATVMMTSLTSLAYVATNAFGQIGMTREQQTANALLDEALEQLRALPYDTVWLGMRTSDLAGDPRIIGAGTTLSPYRLASNNERIVHVSNNTTVAPLVPNSSVRTVNKVVYTVRVYVSYYQDDPSIGTVTGTAYVDWFSGLHRGNRFARATTIIFSPAAVPACALPTQCYGWQGPVLPSFGATTSAAGGQMTITTGPTTGLAIDPPDVSSTSTLAQLNNVHGESTSETIGMPSATPPVWGPLQKIADATSSPPNITNYSEGHDSSSPPASQTVPFGGQNLTVTVSGASSVDTWSTLGAGSAAPAGGPCSDLSGGALNDGLPCAKATGSSGATTATVDLTTLGGGLGTMDVMQLGAATAGVHMNRDLTQTSGTVCAGTYLSGCVYTKATRSMSSIKLGGLPAALRPVGFGSLVELTGYTDSVTAEAGVYNVTTPPPSATASGTLRYWNGLGYTTSAWASVAGASLTIPGMTVTLGTTSITITADLRAGKATYSSQTGTCLKTWAVPCTTKADASVTSPLLGTVNYDIKVLGVTQLAFTIAVDFGTVTTSTQYIDPP